MKNEILFQKKIHPHQKEAIIEALSEIFINSQNADKVIEKTHKQRIKWGARDRRFFAENVYNCVRWFRRLAYTQSLENNEQFNKNDIENIWKAWLSLQDKSASNLVLQKWNHPPARSIAQSIPEWFDSKGAEDLGTRWESVLASLNTTAKVYIRTNIIKTSRSQLIHHLRSVNIECEEVSGYPDAIKILERQNLSITTLFRQGQFEIQDIVSQMIAPMLSPEPGMRVIDACAGGGGKTLHIAALMQNRGKIIALDKHEWRLKPLRSRATRAGVDIIETRVITTAKIIKRLFNSADRLLLDVPCSGSGVLKRSPDTKWKLTPVKLQEYETIQKTILDSYAPMCKTGGRMVYSTCSIFRSENEEQIRWFLQSQTGKHWKLIEEKRFYPDESDGDGFYAAVLEKISD